MQKRGDQIHIHIQFSRQGLRRVLKWGLVTAVLGAPLALLASTVSLPFGFSPGEPVSSAELNANFQALRDAINNNQVQLTSIQTQWKRVFVSSDTSDADRSGIAGANLHCQNLATAAGLPGTYLAWIAVDGGPDPSTTFTRSGDPYRLVDGTLVAQDWADLTDGTIHNAINTDENGAELATGDLVHTNVQADGTFDGSVDCDGWTSTSAGNGIVGFSTRVDSPWTRLGATDCDNQAHLYCFQQ